MKKIILLLYIFISMSSHAQQPVLDIELLKNHLYEIESNAYYKDVDNYYNHYVGTWIYQDATKTIRLRFVKKEQKFYSTYKNYFLDFLIGEVQFIENGVEKINTLYNLDFIHGDIYKYSIVSSTKIRPDWRPVCQGCSQDEWRLAMNYNEIINNDLGLSAYFYIRCFNENGIQKMQLQYGNTNGPNGINRFDPTWETPSTSLDFKLSYGEYVLTKE